MSQMVTTPVSDSLHIAILGGAPQGEWGCASSHVPALRACDGDRVAEIGIVGIGEGSTPQRAALLADLGLADADWMKRADATYKAGTAFHGWSDRPGHESYFILSPFANPVDLHTEPAFHHAGRLRRAGRDVAAHRGATS